MNKRSITSETKAHVASWVLLYLNITVYVLIKNCLLTTYRRRICSKCRKEPATTYATSLVEAGSSRWNQLLGIETNYNTQAYACKSTEREYPDTLASRRPNELSVRFTGFILLVPLFTPANCFSRIDGTRATQLCFSIANIAGEADLRVHQFYF